jgi:hypothetical protein
MEMEIDLADLCALVIAPTVKSDTAQVAYTTRVAFLRLSKYKEMPLLVDTTHYSAICAPSVPYTAVVRSQQWGDSHMFPINVVGEELLMNLGFAREVLHNSADGRLHGHVVIVGTPRQYVDPDWLTVAVAGELEQKCQSIINSLHQ